MAFAGYVSWLITKDKLKIELEAVRRWEGGVGIKMCAWEGW